VGQRVKEVLKRWALPLAIAVLVLGGLYAVAEALNVWVAVGVGAAVSIAVWRPSWRCATLVILRLAGAIVVAFLAMVGVALLLNLLLGLLHHIHPLRHLKVPIAIGLIVATVAFAAVAYWYLRRADWKVELAAPVALVLALLVVLGAPYLVGRLKADSSPVAAAHPVPSQLDLLIVTDGSAHPVVAPPLPSRLLSEFDITYSVGYAEGEQVRWTLLNGGDREAALTALAEGSHRPRQAGRPTPRPEADHVLLLYVNGTPPVVGDPAGLPNVEPEKDAVARWRGVAKSVRAETAGRLPSFALLQTTGRERLNRWRESARPNVPVSAQALGSQTATDAAARLAVAAPTAEQDFALALQYRPILLFDKREPVPRPLSITALFNEKRVRLCHDQGVAKTTCDDPITNPELLENGGTHLRLDLPDPESLRREAFAEAYGSSSAEVGREVSAAARETLPEALPPSGAVPRAEQERVGSQSAIYVHPVTVAREGRELLYLDYWWYLPYNPVKLGGGALCGAGLVIAGITCQDHESDWEGVTVVVDRSGGKPEPAAVQYAQHSHVVRYSWHLLQEKWGRLEERREDLRGGESSLRPLVFVAVGTHASYPVPCPSGCRQFPDPGLPEEPHLGNLPWRGNDTSACGKSSCLQELPTHDGGREPALWNGYDGAWGELQCFLTYYCDSGTPPQSPGHQRRYEHPTWFDGYAGTDWRFHEAPSAE
jgi:hypothetical protein